MTPQLERFELYLAVRRCEVTGNPCGTDTRPEGDPCRCEGCRG